MSEIKARIVPYPREQGDQVMKNCRNLLKLGLGTFLLLACGRWHDSPQTAGNSKKLSHESPSGETSFITEGSGSELQLTAESGKIVVTQLMDEDNGTADGSVSLREAVAIANASAQIGLIEFHPRLAQRTMKLTRGQIVISSTLSIIGPQGGITLDAGRTSRIFRIANPDLNVAVSLERLNFMNGEAPDEGPSLGGSGYQYPNIRGGAIYNTENLVIKDSLFTNNRALRGGALVSDGGSLSISGSKFVGNLVGEFGGAVLFDTGSSLSIENCEFIGNEAGTITVVSSSMPQYVVPEDRFLGAAITIDPENYVLRNITFASNKAARGGAIYLFQSKGICDNCSFASSNTASIEGSAIWTASGTLQLNATRFESGIKNALYNWNNTTTITVK
jgi:hypothetical protein